MYILIHKVFLVDFILKNILSEKTILDGKWYYLIKELVSHHYSFIILHNIHYTINKERNLPSIACLSVMVHT